MHPSWSAKADHPRLIAVFTAYPQPTPLGVAYAIVSTHQISETGWIGAGMADFKNKEDLTLWLSGLPDERRLVAARVLAAKAALLVLPFVVHAQKGKNIVIRAKAASARRVLLSLRAAQISTVIAAWGNNSIKLNSARVYTNTEILKILNNLNKIEIEEYASKACGLAAIADFPECGFTSIQCMSNAAFNY